MKWRERYEENVLISEPVCSDCIPKLGKEKFTPITNFDYRYQCIICGTIYRLGGSLK